MSIIEVLSVNKNKKMKIEIEKEEKIVNGVPTSITYHIYRVYTSSRYPVFSLDEQSFNSLKEEMKKYD